MHKPIFCSLVLGLLSVVPGCETQTCTQIAYEPPRLRVFVRDAETSAAICDAKVEVSIDGNATPDPLRPVQNGSGDCRYEPIGASDALAKPATVTVTHVGYGTATAAVVRNRTTECGNVFNDGTTVKVTAVK